ncbi:hypothetical protein MPSEU_000779400 [Mayamaea pseudoterrestris]|nr:hypothetical protein MPSEU_000779400 [Mayamaea pseudoterrestris]
MSASTGIQDHDTLKPTKSGLIPNWRSISSQECLADADSSFPNAAASILRTRAEWSQDNFQDALDLYDKLNKCQDSYISGRLAQALKSLDSAYRLYRPESVICSFNGGKDAVVILHLVRAACAHYHATMNGGKNTPLHRPRVIYFNHNDEFPEILEFLRETVEQYDLDMIAFDKEISFPAGLQILVDTNVPPSTIGENNQQPYPMAFVLGTRESDPNAGAQGQFAPSSSSYMPPFMRVNPILHWNYGHVWHFLRLQNLPYCRLYDQGYTSLGTTKNTVPCPALQVAGADGSRVPKFWPAYMLRDYDQERAGRMSSTSNSSKKTKAKQSKDKTYEESETNLSSRNSSEMDRFSTYTDSVAEPVNATGTNSAAVTFDNVIDVSTFNVTNAAGGEDDDSVVSYSSDANRQKSVGLLIVGDEILKGFTQDTNTQAAAKALFCQNVVLKRVVVVSDKQECIVQEIHRLQKEVDVIITSGGVGPTHDDVTIKSVAEALKYDMIVHEEMSMLLKDKMNAGDRSSELTEAQLKMATLPSASKLRYLSGPSNWPVLQVRNIFILPGVPEFFSAKIEDVSRYLSCQLERSAAYKVVLSTDENTIVPILNAVVENHPNVSIGSYPFVSHPEYKTVITVEGRLLANFTRSNSSVFDRLDLSQRSPKVDLDKYVQLALDELITTLPKGSVLRVDDDDLLL